MPTKVKSQHWKKHRPKSEFLRQIGAKVASF